MSIYIGNNGANKVLHLYSGSSNIEKNINPLITSFHSSMPYLKCISKNRFYPTTSIPFTNDGHSFYFYSSTPIVPSKQTIMLFYKNGITTSYSTYISDGYIVYGYNNYIRISNGITDTNHFPRPSYDYIDVYQFDSIISTDVSSLSIDNNSFIINNENIMNNMYLVPIKSINDRLNDYDLIVPVSCPPEETWLYPYYFSDSYYFSRYDCTSTSVNIVDETNVNAYPFSNTTIFQTRYYQIINSYNYGNYSSIDITSNNISRVMSNGTIINNFSTAIKPSYVYMSETVNIPFFNNTQGSSGTLIKNIYMLNGNNDSIMFTMFSNSGAISLPIHILPFSVNGRFRLINVYGNDGIPIFWYFYAVTHGSYISIMASYNNIGNTQMPSNYPTSMQIQHITT